MLFRTHQARREDQGLGFRFLSCISPFLLEFIYLYLLICIFSGQNVSKTLKVIDNRTPVLRLVRLEQQDPNFFPEKPAEFRQKIKKFMSENDNRQSLKDPDDSNGAPGVGGNPSSSGKVNPSSTESSNFEKDNKLPRTKTYKRKSSTTTNGFDGKKKSKPKLLISEVVPALPSTAPL